MKYFLLFLFTAVVAVSQEARYETATGTNTITIADYESGELISVMSPSVNGVSPRPQYVSVIKNGKTFQLSSAASFTSTIGGGVLYSASGVGDVFRGPATFFINNTNVVDGFTIRITPVSFPPNQTLIVGPGTNQIQVSMESSTNLVNWQTATNGVYGSPETVRFFRLKMTNLTP